jgi:arylsulfatase A-like enzyme
VPFIARMPGTLPAGRRVASMASGVDILPTLCAMAKVPLPADVTIDGKDLTPVLLKGAASPHEEIILFDNENVVGIRTQRWKYVDRAYYRTLNLPFGLMNLDELYDLSIDPGENYSVASLHPAVLADMKARFARAKATFLPMKHKDIPQVYKTLRQVLGPLQD